MRVAIRFLQITSTRSGPGSGVDALTSDGAVMTFDGAEITFLAE